MDSSLFCRATPVQRPKLTSPQTPRRVAAAPFGGPVAVVRDEEALVVVRGGAPAGRPLVRVFTCAGALLGSFLWEGGRLVCWGWSSELELVMVDAGAKVREEPSGDWT